MSRIYKSQLLTVGDEAHTLREWSAITGVKTTTMYWRLKHGYKPEEIVGKPREHRRSRPSSLLTVGAETKALRDWSKLTGVKMNTMYWRLAQGCKAEEVVAQPKPHVSLQHREYCNRGHRMTSENKRQYVNGAVICRQCSRDQFREYKAKNPVTFAMLQALSSKFWKLVQRAPGSKCWSWLGARDVDGYGTFNVGYHVIRTHRAALAFKLGRLVVGMSCHKCGNPRCCRKAHLYEGNSKTNALDTVRHGHTLRGESNPHAKLKDTDVRRIRATYRQGRVSQRALAERFAVSQATVALIVKHITWRHVKAA